MIRVELIGTDAGAIRDALERAQHAEEHWRLYGDVTPEQIRLRRTKRNNNLPPFFTGSIEQSRDGATLKGTIEVPVLLRMSSLLAAVIGCLSVAPMMAGRFPAWQVVASAVAALLLWLWIRHDGLSEQERLLETAIKMALSEPSKPA